MKVTDKRIFTADGDIREEFRDEIRPVEPSFTPAAAAPAAEAPPPAESTPRKGNEERRVTDDGPPPGQHERRRTIQDKAQNPGTPFTDFVQSLIMQAYMSLGMLRNPYAAGQPTVDAAAARELIEIVAMLKEKTAGNLTFEEQDFLETHLGELKLAFVQRTKTL